MIRDSKPDQKYDRKWLRIVFQENFRYKISKFIFPVIITITLISVLVSQIQFNKLILGKLTWIYMIPIILGICCSYFVRACFFSKSLQQAPVSFNGFFLVTGVYSWIAVFLPLGLGHLSYPYLLEKCYNIRLSEGISSLLAYNVIRVFLLIGITLWAFLSLDINTPDLPIGIKWDFITYGFFAFTAVVLIGILLRNIILERLGRVGIFFNNVIQALSKTLASKQIGTFLFFAAAADLFNLVVFYFSFLFAGCSLPISRVGLVFGLANLSVLLPIHGIGNIGSLEAIFTLVLVGFGQTINEAVQIGFAVHIIQLIVRTVIGLVCYFFLKCRA